MDFVTILLLSIAVAADCFVVSVSNGIALNKFIFSPIIKMAFLFGLFQAMMPVFSWLAGKQCGSWIEPYDHWIALAILSFLGAKMIWESFDENSDSEGEVVLHWGRLIILAIATSIDALAIGLLFVTETTERFVFAVICIGLCSFVFSLIGNCLGIKIGNRMPFNTERIAGCILIIIGIKIFIEHTLF